MRILIKTFRLSSNYGCILQAFALQKVLKDMGHDVVTWDSDEPFYRRMTKGHRILSVAKQIVRKFVLSKRDEIIDIDGFAAKRSALSNKYTKQFVEKNINRLVEDKLNEIDGSKFDCVIAGSDQIWRYYGDKSSLKNNFLAFTKGWKIKRIAYAASFGVDNWQYDESITKELQSLAKQFDAVSVREKSGVKLCENNLNIEATYVLDPTMLLSKDIYISLCRDVPQSEGDLLYYILDDSPSVINAIFDFATRYKFRAFSVSAPIEKRNIPFDWRIQPPVEQWLRGFMDAQFVITDSFHACVFAIIFNKPFICLGNIHRGMTRFESLLITFGLQDRIVNINQMNSRDTNFNMLFQVNWEDVNNVLKEMQTTSVRFLNEAFDK